MRVITKAEFHSLIFQKGAAEAALGTKVAQAAADYVGRVKEKMRAPKSGRTYRRAAITRAASPDLPKGLTSRTGPGGSVRLVVGYQIHRASAPGEAPAVDTSILINSIFVRPIMGLRIVIVVLAEYAAAVEAIRPVFEPTLAEIEPDFVRDVNEEVARLCQ
jgi:hypothetical protein